MNYLVIWKPEVERRLNDIWNTAPNPDRVLDAAVELERRLRLHPESEGESRDHGRRITFEAPLGVYFKVLSEEQTVNIFAVWEF